MAKVLISMMFDVDDDALPEDFETAQRLVEVYFETAGMEAVESGALDVIGYCDTDELQYADCEQFEGVYNCNTATDSCLVKASLVEGA